MMKTENRLQMTKLPQKFNENFFNRLIAKIKSIFYNNKVNEHNNNKNENTNNSVEEKNNQKKKYAFIEHQKIDYDNHNEEIEKMRLLKRLDEKPELLDTFSNDKLEKIYLMYVEEIKKEKKILEKLKKNNI